MRLHRHWKPILAIAVATGVVAAGYWARERWWPGTQQSKAPASLEATEETATSTGKVIVSEQAQKNLGLIAKPLKPQVFWKTIPVPGMVVDRPGLSDRGVVAPATGVVARIVHVPGDTVRPGETLFTLKLLSESLNLTQTELFKATQDIRLAKIERARLSKLADTVAGSRLIEKENEITRLQVAEIAYRQELLNRGFSTDLIDGVAEGKFIREITIVVPSRPAGGASEPGEEDKTDPLTFEVQELKVEPGQQVQAGQTLCLLANHQKLAVEGRAFRDETPLLEKSVKEKWPVEVDFQEDAAAGWSEVKQVFRIRHMANTIDPVNRTFAFRLPLENESRVVDDDGRMQTLWRFRPGQRVRLQVRVEKVVTLAPDGKTEILPFVLPADAVAHEGPEAFVFTQNVNTFERKPVRVLLQDRQNIVLANDGSLLPGTYVVQGGAAQLNRMVKAGGSAVPKGYHIHADGSLHKNEDEGK